MGSCAKIPGVPKTVVHPVLELMTYSLPTSGPIAEAPRAAAALQNAAYQLSPTTAMAVALGSADAPRGSTYGDSETLGAGTPAKPTGPAAREALNQPRHAVVPASVTNAAAALAKQLRATGQIRASPSNVGDARLNASQGRNRAATHGKSVWTSAPPGVTPEMRLAADLPASEFTYIERPWSHFVTRWAAIDWEMQHFCSQGAFSLLDLGSCTGFFSLQAATAYPESLVVGVEGSVGIGNGTTGLEGKEDDIIATKAVQTHIQWAETLKLANCLLAPEVWDFHRICSLANLGRPICNVFLNLSVIHHIDGISEKQYLAANLSPVEGTVTLMSKLLLLANRHFVELPDAPWIEHIWNTFRSPREFLEAAARASGRQWTFTGPLVVSEWYGRRELWMVEDADGEREVVPPQGLRAMFARVIGPKGNADWLKTQATWPANVPTGSAAPRAIPSRQQQLQQPQDTEVAPSASRAGATAQICLPPDVATWTLQEQLGAALLAAPTALIAAHVQLRDTLADAAHTLQDAGDTTLVPKAQS